MSSHDTTRMKEVDNIKTTYLNQSPANLVRDFPKRKVRLLFPGMPYSQDYCRDRINAVVQNGLVTKIWIE